MKKQAGWIILIGLTLVDVGFGGSQCSWVAYEIKPGEVLDGVWGGYGSTNIGTEKAVKQR